MVHKVCEYISLSKKVMFISWRNSFYIYMQNVLFHFIWIIWTKDISWPIFLRLDSFQSFFHGGRKVSMLLAWSLSVSWMSHPNKEHRIGTQFQILEWRYHWKCHSLRELNLTCAFPMSIWLLHLSLWTFLPIFWRLLRPWWVLW